MSRLSRSSSDSPTGSAPRRENEDWSWRRAWDALSDSLREHPIFDLEDEHESRRRPGVVAASALSGKRRESLYEEQLLRIFLVRLRLTAAIGIGCMAVFVGFYFLIFPNIAREILICGAVAIAGMCGQILLTFRVKSLRHARLLSLVGYAIFSVSSAMALPLVTAAQSWPDFAAAQSVQFVIVISFAHILLTTLILPLRLGDTLAIDAVVLGALIFGLQAIPDGQHAVSSLGALWAVGTLSLFITLLTHFNSRLRRRVFDSAFDLALQALSMKEISETDALTKGFNRRHCERVLTNEMVRAARFGRPLSLLMFDLDNFKPVNDNLGHAAGDQVLIAVHEAAVGELREVDDLSRIGGDEFLIVLPETDGRQTQRIARRLHARVLRELDMSFGHASLLGKVTISIGALTLESGHNLDAEAALERVDELLYNAKNQGKNRVASGQAGG